MNLQTVGAGKSLGTAQRLARLMSGSGRHHLRDHFGRLHDPDHGEAYGLFVSREDCSFIAFFAAGAIHSDGQRLQQALLVCRAACRISCDADQYSSLLWLTHSGYILVLPLHIAALKVIRIRTPLPHLVNQVQAALHDQLSSAHSFAIDRTQWSEQLNHAWKFPALPFMRTVALFAVLVASPALCW